MSDHINSNANDAYKKFFLEGNNYNEFIMYWLYKVFGNSWN